MAPVTSIKAGYPSKGRQKALPTGISSAAGSNTLRVWKSLFQLVDELASRPKTR